MNTQSHRRKSLIARFVLGLVIAGSAALAVGCAYNEVMNERNAEGEYLQRQLEQEQARGQALGR